MQAVQALKLQRDAMDPRGCTPRRKQDEQCPEGLALPSGELLGGRPISVQDGATEARQVDAGPFVRNVDGRLQALELVGCGLLAVAAYHKACTSCQGSPGRHLREPSRTLSSPLLPAVRDAATAAGLIVVVSQGAQRLHNTCYTSDLCKKDPDLPKEPHAPLRTSLGRPAGRRIMCLLMRRWSL